MVLILGPVFFPLIILLIQEDPGFSFKSTHPPYQYIPQKANKKMDACKNTNSLW